GVFILTKRYECTMILAMQSHHTFDRTDKSVLDNAMATKGRQKNQSLGEAITELRMQRGWSQRKLSRISGVSQATIWRIEHPSFNGRVHPTVAAGIAQAFGPDGVGLFTKDDLTNFGRSAGTESSCAKHVIPDMAHSGVYTKPGVTTAVRTAYCHCGMQLPIGRAECDYCNA
ncbi:MAG: helix-turn-helix transcriptional regulator, partial [Candidatus Saccharimonadales bacterium]